jgi:hypothetical protein
MPDLRKEKHPLSIKGVKLALTETLWGQFDGENFQFAANGVVLSEKLLSTGEFVIKFGTHSLPITVSENKITLHFTQLKGSPDDFGFASEEEDYEEVSLLQYFNGLIEDYTLDLNDFVEFFLDGVNPNVSIVSIIQWIDREFPKGQNVTVYLKILSELSETFDKVFLEIVTQNRPSLQVIDEDEE